MFKVKILSTCRKKKLSKNIRFNRFAMRPYNRCIKYNLKYFILK